MPKSDSKTTEVASHFGPDGLRISTRALNCLQYDEITTIQQVRSIGYAGLVRMPNMGVRCAKEVWEAAYSDQAERLLQQTTTRYQHDGWGWNGDLCAVWGQAIVLGETREEKEARAKRFAASAAVLDAAENVVIAFGMGWDMEGVIAKLKEITDAN